MQISEHSALQPAAQEGVCGCCGEEPTPSPETCGNAFKSTALMGHSSGSLRGQEAGGSQSLWGSLP